MREILYILPVLALIETGGNLISGQSRPGYPVLNSVEQEDTASIGLYLKDHYINVPVGSPATTLLVHAVKHSGAGLTGWLISRGADVNLRVEGISPLMYACGRGNVRQVRILLDAGAEIGATDPEGNSALFYAAGNGNLKTVKFLFKQGADISRKNHTWNTAYDMAVRTGNTETAQYLRSRVEKSLPDLLDGPYIRWGKNNRIRSVYLEHDAKSQITRRRKSTVRATSDPFLLEGSFGDTLSYLLRSQKDPPPDDVQDVRKVLVMGDIHGGYDSLVLFLRNNGVIGSSLNWTWGGGHLVFVGDILDRGEGVTEALWLIYRLEDQAARAGGAVHLILGNHEIMVLSGNLSYTTDKYILMTSRLNMDYSGLFGRGTILGQWLRSRNSIVRINGFLFVHAGLSPELVKTGLSLHEINATVRGLLNKPDHKNTGVDFRKVLFGSTGPFWYRGYLEENHEYQRPGSKDLEEILNYFGGRKIFVGHTNVENITSYYGGRVFALDVPFYTYGNPIRGLLFEDDALYLLNSEDAKTEIQ